jgi:hypothetical protein
MYLPGSQVTTGFWIRTQSGHPDQQSMWLVSRHLSSWHLASCSRQVLLSEMKKSFPSNQKTSSSSSFMDRHSDKVWLGRLDHWGWAPHHRSRVEKEMLLGYRVTSSSGIAWLYGSNIIMIYVSDHEHGWTYLLLDIFGLFSKKKHFTYVKVYEILFTFARDLSCEKY